MTIIGALFLGLLAAGTTLAEPWNAELKISADQPCDERCADVILTRAYEKPTNSLQDQLRALQAAGRETAAGGYHI